jgi:hypothetical protein
VEREGRLGQLETDEVPVPWGDELNKLRADYPDLDIWTIRGRRWLTADRASDSGLLPIIRRNTSGQLREALEMRRRGRPVPLDLE